MSDPVDYADATNPCATCAGARVVQSMSWRVPSYWVICLGDGRYAAGDSVAEVVAAWDLDNPTRTVTPEDAYAMEVTILEATLTPAVDAIIQDAALVFSHSAETQNLATFLTWCTTVATP
jgi:hypothetical protein